MDDLETRELRYFVTVAEEAHFGRAAARLGMSQPPLSRAVQQLEQRIGAALFDRTPRGVVLTAAGTVLLEEARPALQAVARAGRRARRAGQPTRRLVLAVKAGADHDLLQELLDVQRADPLGLPLEVRFGEVHEQGAFLRDGTADVAIMHRTYDDLTGFDTEDLRTEQQVAILPRSHRLAARASVSTAELRDLPDLPAARWPRIDGTYPDGPGPEVHSQAQLAQLVALGHTVIVIPRSSRTLQWPEHVAVPVLDAPPATTVVAWPAASTSQDVARVVRNAAHAAATLAGAEARSA
ncbi:LysR family transcriptional regulator [Curtobacterium sp. VKM Ac-2922]|uniref:LysR family transcriptional regulator n=1 Tax=Curtobacterium sp. VKM Ac-2922 TaxID=2929475 RepID=UPI001FB2B555|nr:LysR family transcriptional regulator [Curtobacterium sp. VKM Ac-2922]MCJ1714467.1 LysR family transcriptional regulator [Curtobacterium sp. VKM Ac-2922]